MTDKLAYMDAAIAHHSPPDGTPVSEKPHQRYIGLVDAYYCGVPVQAGVEPYLMYVLRRADRAMVRASDQERDRVTGFLSQVGLAEALPGERGYSVTRRDQVEVWERHG